MATQTKTVDMYIAVETGAMQIDDAPAPPFQFWRGLTRVHGNHPAVKRAPEFWELYDGPEVTYDPNTGRRWAPER
jgi:hypothetical protein